MTSLFSDDSTESFLQSLSQHSSSDVDSEEKNSAQNAGVIDSSKEVHSATDNVESSSLIVKPSRSTSSVSSFLDSLSHVHTISPAQQAKQQQEQEAKESQEQLNELHMISSYYNNPKYQSAMSILNDSELQDAYSQSLQSINWKLFQYAEKVQAFHPPQTGREEAAKQQEKNMANFMQQLQHSQGSTSSNLSTNQSVVRVAAKQAPLSPATKLSSKSSNSTASFLASLKG